MEDHSAQRSRSRWAAILATAVLAALLGGLTGGALVFAFMDGRAPAASPPAEAIEPSPGSMAIPQISMTVEIDSAVTQAVSQVGPAVVTVVAHLPRQITFFGTTIEPSSSGSGVIISEDGYIVTNNHVVENAQRIEVILADGRTLPAALVGVDVYADLAVLKAEGEMPAVAEWGNSDALKPGEPVVAIGSPLGDFTNTVTLGVVSATERAIEVEEGFFLEGLIQTDAAINQGNSGGPLINLAGQIVGINTLIVRGSGQGGAVAEGLGFAIPSNTARVITEQLVANGYFARPYLGIRWVAITPTLARRYGLPAQHGIYISYIQPRGPADRAGLKRGDIITAIEGQPIDDQHPFRNELFHYQPQDVVKLTVLRGERHLEIEVRLGTMPPPG